MLTRDKTCEDDIPSLIESDGGTKIEKCCSFVIQKQISLYIIHFTHDLLRAIHTAREAWIAVLNMQEPLII